MMIIMLYLWPLIEMTLELQLMIRSSESVGSTSPGNSFARGEWLGDLSQAGLARLVGEQPGSGHGRNRGARSHYRG